MTAAIYLISSANSPEMSTENDALTNHFTFSSLCNVTLGACILVVLQGILRVNDSLSLFLSASALHSCAAEQPLLRIPSI